MSELNVGFEIVEVNVDEKRAHLYLRVETDWDEGIEVRAHLTGPHNEFAPTRSVTHTFKPLKRAEEDVGEDVRSFEVVLPKPALWSPESPARYHGTLELWEDGAVVGSLPLHYSLYNLTWVENEIAVNEEPLTPCVRRLDALDEPTARQLRTEGVNVVLLPASEVAAWELADRLGLFLLGELPADGALPDDLLDRSVRPCCLGWVFPSIETPLPGEIIPGLFGLRSDLPYEELPEGIDFVVFDTAPKFDDLGYSWIVL